MAAFSREMAQLAGRFASCRRTRLVLGDKKRQHLILKMLQMKGWLPHYYPCLLQHLQQSFYFAAVRMKRIIVFCSFPPHADDAGIL